MVGMLEIPPAWTHLGARCCCMAKRRLIGGNSLSLAFSINTLDEMSSKNFWKSLNMQPAFWFSFTAISASSDQWSAARRQLLPLEAESVLRVCSVSHSATSLSIRHCIL